MLIQVRKDNCWITVPMSRMEKDGVWVETDGQICYFDNEDVGLIW